MLSDEEKQAIEYLKRHIIPCYGRKGTIEFMLNDTLLNLIEKQSKEIEELNLENIELKQSKIVDKNSIPNQDNFYDCYNCISKKEAEQKEKRAYIDGTNVAHELCNKMWKDKIKAKIEEVSNGTYDAKIVLQELLEKE